MLSEKNCVYILKAGIFAAFISLFLSLPSLVFPFVTSKQLSFNILIEVLMIFYFILILKHPQYRPKKSMVSISLLLYFAAILLSVFISPDFNLSFWGNMERMLGFFHLLHFLGFYFIIITVFKTKKDYVHLLQFMLLSSFVAALMALIPASVAKYPNSILGNRAYFAAMMLLSFFVSAFLFVQSKSWWFKSAYLVTIPFLIYAFIWADITGSQVALIASVFTGLLLLSIFTKVKKIRVASISALVLAIVTVVLLLSFRHSPVLDDTLLGKTLRSFTTNQVTFNTRLVSWESAFKYLSNNPLSLVFGVGHGNYALVFDQYFDARFYDYDRGETYFDRAHNNIIDIIATTGLLGLISYMSFIIFMFYYLYRAHILYKENPNHPAALNVYEFSILVSLLVAYFVQNLAVFDSFSSYFYILIIAAYITSLEIGQKSFALKDIKAVRFSKESLFIFFALISLLLIFNVNIRAWRMSNKVIDAYILVHQEELWLAHETFQEAIDMNSVLQRDGIDAYLNFFVPNFKALPERLSPEEMDILVESVIDAVHINLAYNTRNSLMLMNSSRAYEAIARYYYSLEDMEKAANYFSIALSMINFSIEASPERVPLYTIKSNILISLNLKDEALETLEYAKQFNERTPDSYCHLASFYLDFAEYDLFLSSFNECIERGAIRILSFEDSILRFGTTLTDREDYTVLADAYDIILTYHERDLDWVARSALAYYYDNQLEKARAQALLALELDPSIESEINEFLILLDEE